ncbi:MAG: hypothetical protein HRU20_06010 [Pseudomonadales bacterium]|nr:hypothetical protein [Pseudomonadales bacterium]
MDIKIVSCVIALLMGLIFSGCIEVDSIEVSTDTVKAEFWVDVAEDGHTKVGSSLYSAEAAGSIDLADNENVSVDAFNSHAVFEYYSIFWVLSHKNLCLSCLRLRTLAGNIDLSGLAGVMGLM